MNETNGQSTERTPDHHVIFQDGAWAILPDGAKDPVRTFDDRDEAVRWIGRSMHHQGANVVVHNEDGSVNDTIRPES